jgi:outer membrane receptor protein involved in Fe transport
VIHQQYRRWAASVALSAIVACMSAPAQAQEAEADSRDTVGEIIVTAQKRAENVQDVPIAITALTSADLAAARIEDSKDLQFNAPNVTLSANRNITIRGVGSASFGGTGDTNIGVLVNGVFLQAGSSFGEFFDLERIEVLRGPQGTLFGRNTTGGVINFISKRPTEEFEGFVDAQLENYRGVRLSGAINIPITSGISQRFAANFIKREGYTRNLFDNSRIDGRDQYTLRSSTRIQPTDTTTVDLTLTYFSENSDRQNAAKSLCTPHPTLGCGPDSVSTAFPTANFRIDAGFLPGAVRPGTFTNNPRNLREVSIDVDPRQKAEDFLGTLEINQELGALTLTSVTGLRDGDNSSVRDFDQGSRPNAFNPGTFNTPLGPVTIPNDGRGNGVLTYLLGDGKTVTTTDYRTAQEGRGSAKQFSQELRLASDFEGPFDFLVGAYYLNARASGFVATYVPANRTFGSIAIGDTKLGKVVSKAIFGEAYFDITPELKILGGLRYSEDKKRIITASGTFVTPAPFRGKATFDKVTGRASINWNPANDLTDDTNIYLSFSRGFKSGGFNPGNVGVPTFESETIDAIEFGHKNVLLDGRLRVNMALFNYNYSNLVVGNIVGTLATNVNIPKSRVRGFELEVTATPVSGLRFEGALGLLDAEIRSSFLSSDPTRGGTRFQLRGNQLPNAPRRTLKLAAEYTHEVSNDWSIRPRVDFYSQSGFYSREFNVGADRVDSWKQLDASVQVARGADKDLSVSLFVKNILNEDAITFLEANSELVGSFRSAFLLDPRIYGVALRVGF